MADCFMRNRALGVRAIALALLAMAGLFPVASQAACSADLSDLQVGPVIEKIENASFDQVPLGELGILPFKRQFLASDGTDYGWMVYQITRAATLAGFVVARSEEDSSELKTLGDWSRITSNAYRTTKIVVQATDLGRRISALTGLDSKSPFVYVFNGTATVVQVLKNQKYASGASEYRVVNGVIGVSNMPPEWQAYRKDVSSVFAADGMEAPGWYAGALADQVKFSTLLEFDESSCNWTRVTSDYAYRGQNFSTNTVEHELTRIQAVSP